MRAFRDVPAGTAEWVPVEGPRRSFELRWGREVLATLEWASGLGSLAWGRHAEGAFSFKRAGFLNPYVSARVPPSEADVARFHLGGGGGLLLFGDGRRYDFLRWGFWSPTWGFRDAYGRGLCRFAPHSGLLKSGAWVSLDVTPVTAPDLPLLVLVGWYAIRLRQEEEAAAGAMMAMTAAAGAMAAASSH